MTIIIVTVSALPPCRTAFGQNASARGESSHVPLGDTGISVTNVHSIVVDNNNVKWFTTDSGLLSFDGASWKMHNHNKSLPSQDLKGISYADHPEGPQLWLASPAGATVVRLPIDETADALTLKPEDTPILGKEVVSIAAGGDSIRWFGTEKGISAKINDKWLDPYYDLHYPEMMFKVFPITSMATNAGGDTLYVATAGAGVARVFRDQLDGISGASVYAQWGPIEIPSDNILSLFIAPDGTKWFGTEKGIARHTGNNTLENWTMFTTEDGLVDNFVQAICGMDNGSVWFGTKRGISVYDGASWTSYTTDNGLASNQILSLAMDDNGILWIGTDVGISAFQDGEFINY
jgi:ligand-binding sensor domain-containing protein